MENRQDPIERPEYIQVPVTGDMGRDRLAGLQAFERISRAFANGIDESEPQAYGNLRKDLMDHSALLVSGGLMSAKEILDKLEDIQTHIRKGGSGGLSVTDQFRMWLNSKSEEA